MALISLGVAGTALAQSQAEYQIQPIFTRHAETVKKITFNSGVTLFHDVQLQEADNFDGVSVDADLTIPIPYTKTFQVRLEWPFYTEGRARLIDKDAPDRGERIHIRGYNGTFQFANVQLEWQFLNQSNHGVNMAAYAGIGESQRVLWTGEDIEDVYNHKGNVAIYGLKADWRAGDEWRFVANLGVHNYYKSDDLNPEGPSGRDDFWLSDFSMAAVWHPWSAPVYPVAELIYQTTFFEYNAVQVVPEVIWAVCQNFELKAGAPLGLTSDGQDYGGRFQATVRF